MKDESAGLLAAAFIGIVPGYISRSVAGSYDNEAIAIFLLMFTFFCWIKALKQGSALFGTIAAVFYFYMVAAWGTFGAQKRHSSIDDTFRWLCLHYKHDPIACVSVNLDGSFLKPFVRRILVVVCDWYPCEYASSVCRVPACEDKRAYGCPWYVPALYAT